MYKLFFEPRAREIFWPRKWTIRKKLILSLLDISYRDIVCNRYGRNKISVKNGQFS